MNELDPASLGALTLLIPTILLLVVILYIVPIPLWIARGRPAPTWAS